VPAASFRWPARRPAHVPLGTEKGQILAPLDCAIQRFALAMQESALGADTAAYAPSGALASAVAAMA
jgi:dTDP-4-dehydrorhamnose reductase